MAELLLVHHSALRGHSHPAGSLSAVRTCLAAGARVVEVDITPIADGDYALLHDGELDGATDGHGPTFAATRDEVRRLRYMVDGQPTDEPVGTLSAVIGLVRSSESPSELQLDLKPHAPLGDPLLRALLATIAPIIDRVRISSVADWALRRLRQLEPRLALGFDPLLYLAVRGDSARDPDVPPFRLGAYGYLDDHPLGTRTWGAASAYLEARAEALRTQFPDGGVWYIDARLLGRSLADGFDWIAYLHGRGCEVAAWTLDAAREDEVRLALRLAAVGVDRITTNDAPALAAALSTNGDTYDRPDHRRVAY
jgi:glycerophosphoryl diester phosphodiesterase